MSNACAITSTRESAQRAQKQPPSGRRQGQRQSAGSAPSWRYGDPTTSASDLAQQALEATQRAPTGSQMPQPDPAAGSPATGLCRAWLRLPTAQHSRLPGLHPRPPPPTTARPVQHRVG